MINKPLIQLIHDAASIQRWNDHIRPGNGFMELDKQAHKMIYAYFIARFENGRGNPVDMVALIEGGIFEFIQRVMLTDIKPPIYHELIDKKRTEITGWLIRETAEDFTGLPDGFARRFERYLSDADFCRHEKMLLQAAHFLTTEWEFKIIRHMNEGQYGIEQTGRELYKDTLKKIDDAKIYDFVRSEKIENLMALIGQLRFQQRWSRLPRIPGTSVMGHMLVVAILSYLVTFETAPCPKRQVNNFFGGLFHDLPEVLTRDIVSPVKTSVVGLDEIIKDIEKKQIEKIIYPLMMKEWIPELEYYVHDEFESKITRDGAIEFATSDEISAKYNSDAFNPMDGALIRACDHLGAYIEASLSIQHGISARDLDEARTNLYGLYRNKKIGGVDFKPLFDYFK